MEEKRNQLCPLKVFVRVRPFRKCELKNGRGDAASLCVVETDGSESTAITTTQVSDRDTRRESFQFEGCFNSSLSGGLALESGIEIDRSQVNADQSTVYSRVAIPVLQKVLHGCNGCILAYGQTGSGKTFTMMGPPEIMNTSGDSTPPNRITTALHSPETQAMEGIIPRIVRDLFESLQQKHAAEETYSFTLEMEYYEVYLEKVMDLLSATSEDALRIRYDREKGCYVEGLTRKRITSLKQVMKYIERGNIERHTRATNFNQRSSRSHAILSLSLTQTQLGSNHDTGEPGRFVGCTTSKLYLVDLAGSERAAAHGAVGIQLQEANKINNSLTVLGRVIDALADKGTQTSGGVRYPFCPYRDSTLTWLLMDCFGGNSMTRMVATVSPHRDHYEETSQTLRYASRAKRIVATVSVNEDSQLTRIRQLMAENKRLQTLAGCGKRDHYIEELRGTIYFLESQLAEKDFLCAELQSKLSNVAFRPILTQPSIPNTEEKSKKRLRKRCKTTEPTPNTQELKTAVLKKESIISTLRKELKKSQDNEEELAKDLEKCKAMKKAQIGRAVERTKEEWMEKYASLEKKLRRSLNHNETLTRELHVAQGKKDSNDFYLPLSSRRDQLSSRSDAKRGGNLRKCSARSCSDLNSARSASEVGSLRSAPDEKEAKKKKRQSSSKHRVYSPSTRARTRGQSLPLHSERMPSPRICMDENLMLLSTLENELQKSKKELETERRKYKKKVLELQQDLHRVTVFLQEERKMNKTVLADQLLHTQEKTARNELQQTSCPLTPSSKGPNLQHQSTVINALQNEVEKANLRIAVLQQILVGKDKLYEEDQKGAAEQNGIAGLFPLESSVRRGFEQEEALQRANLEELFHFQYAYTSSLQFLRNQTAELSESLHSEKRRNEQLKDLVASSKAQNHALVEANENALLKIKYLKHQLEQHSLSQEPEKREADSSPSLSQSKEASEMLRDLQRKLEEVEQNATSKERELQAELDAISDEKRVLQSYIAEEQERNSRLRGEIGFISEQLIGEKSDNEGLREELREEQLKMEKKIFAMEQALAQARAEVKTQEEKNKLLIQENIAALTAQQLTTDRHHEAVISALRSEKNSLEKERCKFIEKLSFLEAQAKSQKEEWCGKLSELQMRFTSERENLMLEIEKVHSHAKTQEEQWKLREKKKVLEEKALMEANEKVLQKIQYTKLLLSEETKKREEAENSKNELSVELEAALREHWIAAEAKTIAEEKNRSLSTEIEKLLQELKRCTSETARFLEEKNAVRATLKETQEALEEKEKQLSDLTKRVEDQEAKIAFLNAEKADLEASLKQSFCDAEKELKSAWTEWVGEKLKLEALNKSLKDKCTKDAIDAQRALQEKEQELLALRSEHEKLIGESMKVKGERVSLEEHLKSKIDRLEAQKGVLVKSISDLRVKNSELKESLQESENKIQEITELSRLKEELDSLEEAANAKTEKTGFSNHGFSELLRSTKTFFTRKVSSDGSASNENYTACEPGSSTHPSSVAIAPSLHSVLSARVDPHLSFRRDGLSNALSEERLNSLPGLRSKSNSKNLTIPLEKLPSNTA